MPPASAPGGADALEGEGSTRFLDAFHAALLRSPRGVVVLFSGGVDSSLVAHCLDHLGLEPALTTVGIAGSPDLAFAPTAAGWLHRPLQLKTLDPGDVPATAQGPIAAEFGDAEPRRSVRLALELAIRSIAPATAVCGQGADELFGGYARYRGVTEDRAEALRAVDLRRLVEEEWPWTARRARAHRVLLGAPFLDPEVVAAALRLPWTRPPEGLEPKGTLRRIARAHGLPEPLADRPKRAMQYGSGIRRAVDRGGRGATSPSGRAPRKGL